MSSGGGGLGWVMHAWYTNADSWREVAADAVPTCRMSVLRAEAAALLEATRVAVHYAVDGAIPTHDGWVLMHARRRLNAECNSERVKVARCVLG